MKKFLNFALLLTVLAVGFAMTSCGGDDENEGNGNTQEVTTSLQNYKWVNKNSDLSFGDDYVTTDQYTTTLYFVNDHQCIVYFHRKNSDTDFGTSYTNEGETVEYSVNGNTVTIGSSQYTSSRYLSFSSTGLTDQNGAIYEKQTMSSQDRDNISKYYRNTDFQNIDDVISKNVSVTSSYSDFSHHVKITSKLSNVYPSNTITYGVEFGYNEYKYEQTFGKNGSSYTEDVSVCLNTDELYLNSVKALNKKVAAGNTLTSDEKDLLSACLKSMKTGATSFKGRIFVEIEGERYYVYSLPKITSSQFDEDAAKYKSTGTSSSYADLIVGTWTLTMDDPTWKCIVTFKSDGTFTSKEYYDIEGDKTFSEYEGTYSGTWKISGKKITITPYSGNSVIEFTGTIKSLTSSSGTFSDSDGWCIYLAK